LPRSAPRATQRAGPALAGRRTPSSPTTQRSSQAGLQRAGPALPGRAQLLPQLSGTADYQRTLQSQFQAISKSAGSSDNGSGGPPDTSSSGGSDLASSPIAKIFAAPSTVTLGLQFSQNIFTAGKLAALNKGADAVERAAIAGVSTARAQLVIDVAQAYYNAVAADRMSQLPTARWRRPTTRSIDDAGARSKSSSRLRMRARQRAAAGD
jgi:outer membrane protein TolC